MVTRNVLGEEKLTRKSPFASAVKGVTCRSVLTTAPETGRPDPYSTTWPRPTSAGGGAGGTGDGVVECPPPPQAASTAAARTLKDFAKTRREGVLNDRAAATSAIVPIAARTSRYPRATRTRESENPRTREISDAPGHVSRVLHFSIFLFLGFLF